MPGRVIFPFPGSIIKRFFSNLNKMLRCHWWTGIHNIDDDSLHVKVHVGLSLFILLKLILTSVQPLDTLAHLEVEAHCKIQKQ